MPSDTLTFIYQDRNGAVTLRKVTSAVPYKDDYIHCYDTTRDDTRTFRRDRIIEIIEDESTAEERLAYHIKHAPPPPQSSKQRKSKGKNSPATTRQRRILKRLRVSFPKDITEAMASSLIEDALDGQPQFPIEEKAKSRSYGCLIIIGILVALFFLSAMLESD